ncbi:MAG: L-serine ammonia-lyase [Corynebacterium sp.]|nr:L-serine ammonia-lyase [Corynebacterium sp.]
MTISIVDLFSVGIGPSSSHTVGPMRAAKNFMDEVHAGTPGADPHSVVITLHGSLAATGKGHGTDRAVLLGLQGLDPATVSPTHPPVPGAVIPPVGRIGNIEYELIFDPMALPEHPNGMTCISGTFGQRYFSVGGGFVLTAAELAERNVNSAGAAAAAQNVELPYPFRTGGELLAQCRAHDLSIPEIMAANETAFHGSSDIYVRHLDLVWETIQSCVQAGIDTVGPLPGGLGVTRRAPRLYQRLTDAQFHDAGDALSAMEWVNLFALAVNEENAAGGRVVTAPTNGAAGVIPAVMHYARNFRPPFSKEKARDFLLTAGAIGMIIKENASISGAEVGCQGEVGSAAAMAAAGLCQVLGGTPEQVENAAEIGLEHNLGLTCDPVGGLVQIPCIERNAIAAVQAVNAARLARLETGIHRVSLDEAVLTMAATGKDMMSKYKETAMGGLAITLRLPVTVTEC